MIFEHLTDFNFFSKRVFYLVDYLWLHTFLLFYFYFVILFHPDCSFCLLSNFLLYLLLNKSADFNGHRDNIIEPVNLGLIIVRIDIFDDLVVHW